MIKSRLVTTAGSLFLAASIASSAFAGPAHINNRNGIRHVLLISIDGMHALDYQNCSNNGTCQTLATLGKTGVNYSAASTSKPSDSFPGLMAIVTGGSPRSVGAYYDVAYDRVLAPPAVDTGNGLSAGPCTKNQNNGTRTEYEEGVDIDQSKLNGGALSGDGGVNSIDPQKLPRDPFNNCLPVFPNNFIRTNTIFGVIHGARGYTAWEDKHPVYSAVAGPGDGSTLDDFYGPEINSDSANFIPQAKMPSNVSCTPLPDKNAVNDGDDYTGSFQNIQCYDALKVQGILNQIDGLTHDGSKSAPVPTIFGMNFQAVSVGQKLIYQHGDPGQGFSKQGGYTAVSNGTGTPTDSLQREIEFVDSSIGLMVSELQKQGLFNATLIVIAAKHGQSPIDINRLLRIPGDDTLDFKGKAPSAILGPTFLPDSEINPNGPGPTEDDVSLLWLTDSSETAEAVTALENASPPLNNIAGIGEIYSGPAMTVLFGTPGVPPNDPRVPDIAIETNIGVVYTGKKKKVAEHGGFAHDDTNTVLLVANPGFAPSTVTIPVTNMQIAPSILAALGLNPSALQAAQLEGTQELPGLGF